MLLWEIQKLIKNLHDECFCEICEKYDVKHMELDILMFLTFAPEYDTAASIAEVRHFAKSHVSGALKALEERGLISKEYMKGNNKTVHLKVTDKASEIISDGKKGMEEYRKIMCRGLSDEDTENLKRYFLICSQNIREYLNEKQNGEVHPRIRITE